MMSILIMSSLPNSISCRLFQCRYSNSRDVVASSPSFSRPAARASQRACSQASYSSNFSTSLEKLEHRSELAWDQSFQSAGMTILPYNVGVTLGGCTICSLIPYLCRQDGDILLLKLYFFVYSPQDQYLLAVNNHNLTSLFAFEPKIITLMFFFYCLFIFVNFRHFLFTKNSQKPQCKGPLGQRMCPNFLFWHL